MTPVPSQVGQEPFSTFPLPWHFGQTSSPVPAVPSGASSPGLLELSDDGTESSISTLVMGPVLGPAISNPLSPTAAAAGERLASRSYDVGAKDWFENYVSL